MRRARDPNRQYLQILGPHVSLIFMLGSLGACAGMESSLPDSHAQF